MNRLASGIGAVAFLAMASVPMPAHADAYRYWSYWTGGDQWTYSARGPGFRVPPDTGVEGWRFVVSPKDGSQAVAPVTASSYDALCPGSAAPAAGQKRVAVVIDFGAAGIAPVGETTPATSVQCVTVPQNQTGLQVLQGVAQLRFHSSGLICGIAGFPATECPGQTVRTATPTASRSTVAPVAPLASVAPSASALPNKATSSATPTPTPSAPEPTYAQPSPVALPLNGDPEPTTNSTPPAWIAAIGAAMIAALLGLAVLARRGRG